MLIFTWWNSSLKQINMNKFLNISRIFGIGNLFSGWGLISHHPTYKHPRSFSWQEDDYERKERKQAPALCGRRQLAVTRINSDLHFGDGVPQLQNGVEMTTEFPGLWVVLPGFHFALTPYSHFNKQSWVAHTHTHVRTNASCTHTNTHTHTHDLSKNWASSSIFGAENKHYLWYKFYFFPFTLFIKFFLQQIPSPLLNMFVFPSALP